jgi:riboflavin kinase / FMN adenylyltransferase
LPYACTAWAVRLVPVSRATIRAGGEPIAEVFVFDFDQATYGRRITVEFLHKLRDEARFPDLDALRQQMIRDVADARDHFAAKR